MVKTAQKAVLLEHNTGKLRSITGKMKLSYFQPRELSFKQLRDLSFKINVANRT
jgi:hypothetical protein